MLKVSPSEAKSIVKTKDKFRKSGARRQKDGAVEEEQSRGKAICPRMPPVSRAEVLSGTGHTLHGGLYWLIWRSVIH